jgi:hypothetical protein
MAEESTDVHEGYTIVSKHSNGSSPQPPRWRLPARHQELLRAALNPGSAERTVSSEQRAIIQQICSAPEKGTFAPEDFVIAFKLALADAANEVGMAPGPDRNEFLARMVSVCIEEYFRASPISDASRMSTGQELAPDSR